MFPSVSSTLAARVALFVHPAVDVVARVEAARPDRRAGSCRFEGGREHLLEELMERVQTGWKFVG
jgi:hypothetical protein